MRYALDRLEECECVTEQIYFQDARQSLYRVGNPAEETGEEANPEAA